MDSALFLCAGQGALQGFFEEMQRRIDTGTEYDGWDSTPVYKNMAKGAGGAFLGGLPGAALMSNFQNGKYKWPGVFLGALGAKYLSDYLIDTHRNKTNDNQDRQ